MGPCLCGDPYCPSCGPAQGYNPERMKAEEALFEELQALLGADVMEDLEDQGLIEFVLDREDKVRAGAAEAAIGFVKNRVKDLTIQAKLVYEIGSGEADPTDDLEEADRMAREYFAEEKTWK
jgi:hypothetical protein